MQIEHYVDENGDDLFEASLLDLPQRARLRARTAVARMEDGNFGDHKSLGDGLLERRIHAEGGIRIYYAKRGEEIVLLLIAGLKASQDKDISTARTRLEDYDSRIDT